MAKILGKGSSVSGVPPKHVENRSAAAHGGGCTGQAGMPNSAVHACTPTEKAPLAIHTKCNWLNILKMKVFVHGVSCGLFACDAHSAVAVDTRIRSYVCSKQLGIWV